MDESLQRYHRQILLPGFGEAGQQRLRASAALVVGCGALGTHIASTLARAGVGHLVIADRDFIERTNLQRQVLFDERDIEEGLPKAEAARRRLGEVNPDVTVTPIVDDVNHTNLEHYALEAAGRPVDLLADGLDNFETRFLLNDGAVKHGFPYVYGGAVGTTGMSYTILPHTAEGTAPWEQAGCATPCLRCIFEQAPPPGMNPTCETAGVFGPTVAAVAAHQSAEALKVLTGNPGQVCRRLRHMDLWENDFRGFKVEGARDASACKCCRERDFEHLAGRFASGTTTLCGRNAVQLTASGDAAVSSHEVQRRLASHGEVSANRFMLRAQIDENGNAYELTLFGDGRAIIKGTKDPTTARGLYARYVGA
jgi:adenylyltransferase/sulfurtransferase